MRRLRLAFACLTAAGSSGSCYAERPTPPFHRFTCSAPEDCSGSEQCIRGLCQVPCTTRTMQENCRGGNFVACLNGTCASVCELDDSTCPGTQTCIDLGLSIDGGNTLTSASGSSEVGLCGDSCLDIGCPQGEICIPNGEVGFCTIACGDDSEACPSDYSCVSGACIPDTVLEDLPPGLSMGAPPTTTLPATGGLTTTGDVTVTDGLPTTGDITTTDGPPTTGDLTATTGDITVTDGLTTSDLTPDEEGALETGTGLPEGAEG